MVPGILAALLAGCSDAAVPPEASASADLDAMTNALRDEIVDVDYESFVSSSPQCVPSACVGGRGNPFWQWDVRGNGSIAALDLILEWADGTQGLGDVAFEVVCVDRTRECEGGPLAREVGAPPLRLTESALEAPSGHAVEIRFWLGDDEWAGSTATQPRVQVTGAFVFLLADGARVVLDDDFPRA